MTARATEPVRRGAADALAPGAEVTASWDLADAFPLSTIDPTLRASPGPPQRSSMSKTRVGRCGRGRRRGDHPGVVRHPGARRRAPARPRRRRAMKPQASVGKGEGAAQPHRLGGLHPAPVGQALRDGHGLPGEREVRGVLERDGVAHGQRRRATSTTWCQRVGRRRPAADLRRRRQAGEHRSCIPNVEEVPPVPEGAAASTRSTASTTASATSSARTSCSTRPRPSRRPRRRGRSSTAPSTRAS